MNLLSSLLSSCLLMETKMPLLLLLVVTGSLLLWHQAMMDPSCNNGSDSDSSVTLQVAVVADLHLAGPRTAWVDRMRRESFMRSVFQKAYRKLKPDALVVLGDVSDAGRKSDNIQWEAVVARFWDLVHPFTAVPIQIVVGNHDVGDHHDPGFSRRLPRFAASFPGLDDTCGSLFSWKGVDFVSLNAMALHGDGCSVCSRVEEYLESTSCALKRHQEQRGQQGDTEIHCKDGAAVSTGPVLLLHLPLYRQDDSACTSVDLPRCAPWHDLEGICLNVVSAHPLVPPSEEPHRVGQDVLSYTSSTQVLELLKPRLVLSGHTHRWCDRVHADGTREITVPSLSWRNRDDPSFVLATFYANSSFTIQRCMLAHESTAILVYIMWGFTILSWLLTIAITTFNQIKSKSLKPE